MQCVIAASAPASVQVERTLASCNVSITKLQPAAQCFKSGCTEESRKPGAPPLMQVKRDLARCHMDHAQLLLWHFDSVATRCAKAVHAPPLMQVERNLAWCDMDLATRSSWSVSSRVGPSTSARGRRGRADTPAASPSFSSLTCTKQAQILRLHCCMYLCVVDHAHYPNMRSTAATGALSVNTYSYALQMCALCRCQATTLAKLFSTSSSPIVTRTGATRRGQKQGTERGEAAQGRFLLPTKVAIM